MIKGGYKIIDLQDVSISTEAVTIDGIYEAIENSYSKPLLLSGIVLDNVEKNDTYVTVTVSDTNYVITVYGYTITITNTDSVTATAVA